VKIKVECLVDEIGEPENFEKFEKEGWKVIAIVITNAIGSREVEGVPIIVGDENMIPYVIMIKTDERRSTPEQKELRR